MITVRKIVGDNERTTVRDTTFPTRREALEWIAREGEVSSIRKIDNNRMYAVTFKKK